MVNIDFFKLAVKAAKIADDKKAIDTIILDVKDLTTITNYFMVTTAESAPQINAISSDIEKIFKSEDAVIPVRREGIASFTWRVIDYG
jgi:ribosome-associated protein